MAKYAGSVTVGTSVPTRFITCPRALPPRDDSILLISIYMSVASSSFLRTGSTISLTLVTSPAEDMMTVPGESTTPSLYFWLIERLSLPVGMFMPRASEKSLAALTASYRRASSPALRQGHIQLADSETLFSPSARGAQTMFVRASAMESTEPAAGSIRPAAGACPRAVAIPLSPR